MIRFLSVTIILPKISIYSVVLVVPWFGPVNCLTIDIHPTPYNNMADTKSRVMVQPLVQSNLCPY